MNKKRVRRLYRLDGPAAADAGPTAQTHRAASRARRRSRPGPTERWSMDFVHDALADGRPFRVLTVVDQWSRQSPILEVASSMSGEHGRRGARSRASPDAPRPRSITVDHGTEFMSRALEDWAYQRGVQLDFIRPGQTRGKRVHRVVQRAAARRVLERPPIHVDRGCEGQDRSVARRLQSAPATQLARPSDTERVRRPTSGSDRPPKPRLSSVELSRFGTNVMAPEQSTFELSTGRGSLRNRAGSLQQS